jgi:hypothetical protein
MYRHEHADNSDSLREVSNHHSDAVSGGISYGNQTLGSLGLIANYQRTVLPNRPTFLPGRIGDSFEVTGYGLTYDRSLGARLKGQIQVTDSTLRRRQAPPGTRLKTSGLNYNAALAYSVNPRLLLSLSATRAFQPSNRPGRLYDLMTGTQLDARYQLGTRFQIGLGGAFQDLNSNVDSTFAFTQPTKSRLYAEFASIQYRQSRLLSVQLALRHEERTANLSAFNYDDTRATLSLNLSL